MKSAIQLASSIALIFCSLEKVIANASGDQQAEPELAFTIFRGDFARPKYGRHVAASSRENLQAIPAPKFRSLFLGDSPEVFLNDDDDSPLDGSELALPKRISVPQFGAMPQDFDSKLGVSQVLFSKPARNEGGKVARGIPLVPAQALKVDNTGFTSPLTLLLKRIEEIEKGNPSAKPLARSFSFQTNDESSLSQERVGRLFPEREPEIEPKAPAVSRPSPGRATAAITRRRGRPAKATSAVDDEKLNSEGSTRRRGSSTRVLKTSRMKSPTEEDANKSETTTKSPPGRLIQGRKRGGVARQRKPTRKTEAEETAGGENPKKAAGSEDSVDSTQAKESNDESAPETGSDFGAKIRA